MESHDELYDGLLKATREVLDAVERQDVEGIGKAIDDRQRYLESLSALEGQKMTDAQKAKYNEIVILDKKASIAVRKLFEKYKNDIKESRVKYEGMSKYNNSQYNLSSGLRMDKKR